MVSHSTIYVIAGPTASGKSDAAVNLAEQMDAVIINADSMQLYTELPILTAQPSAEIQQKIPHALYGIISIKEPHSAQEWLKKATTAIEDAFQRGKTPILVGGTGFYFKALMEGLSPIPDIGDETRENVRKTLQEMGNDSFHALLKERDPVIAERLFAGDTQRILRAMEVWEETGTPLSEWQKIPRVTHFPKEYFKGWVITPPRVTLYEHINQRFVAMCKLGALEEARAVLNMGLPPALPAMKVLGLRELMAYHLKQISLEQAMILGQTASRHYAKRQLTWFRHQLPNLTAVHDAREIII